MAASAITEPIQKSSQIGFLAAVGSTGASFPPTCSRLVSSFIAWISCIFSPAQWLLPCTVTCVQSAGGRLDGWQADPGWWWSMRDAGVAPWSWRCTPHLPFIWLHLQYPGCLVMCSVSCKPMVGSSDLLASPFLSSWAWMVPCKNCQALPSGELRGQGGGAGGIWQHFIKKKKDGNMSWAVSNKTSNILYKDREQKTLIWDLERQKQERFWTGDNRQQRAAVITVLGQSCCDGWSCGCGCLLLACYLLWCSLPQGWNVFALPVCPPACSAKKHLQNTK